MARWPVGRGETPREPRAAVRSRRPVGLPPTIGFLSRHGPQPLPLLHLSLTPTIRASDRRRMPVLERRSRNRRTPASRDFKPPLGVVALLILGVRCSPALALLSAGIPGTKTEGPCVNAGSGRTHRAASIRCSECSGPPSGAQTVQAHVDSESQRDSWGRSFLAPLRCVSLFLAESWRGVVVSPVLDGYPSPYPNPRVSARRR